MGRATWRPENASDPYPFAAWRNVSGQWVPTPLVLHPQLWANVVGEYSLCSVDDSNVLCNVFADTAKDQVHVMLHNLHNRTVDVELNMIGASGMTVVTSLLAIVWQRLRLSSYSPHPLPSIFIFIPLPCKGHTVTQQLWLNPATNSPEIKTDSTASPPSRVNLTPFATMHMQISGLQRAGIGAVRSVLRRTTVYADEAPLMPSGQTLHFSLAKPLSSYANGTLRLGFGGSCMAPELVSLTVNGQPVTLDASRQIAGSVRRDSYTSEFFASQAVPLSLATLVSDAESAQLTVVVAVSCSTYTLTSGVLDIYEEL